MSRWARKAKPPAGFEYLEPTLGQLEAEMRESESLPIVGRLTKCFAKCPFPMFMS